MGPERADLRPERADLRPGRAFRGLAELVQGLRRPIIKSARIFSQSSSPTGKSILASSTIALPTRKRPPNFRVTSLRLFESDAYQSQIFLF